MGPTKPITDEEGLAGSEDGQFISSPLIWICSEVSLAVRLVRNESATSAGGFSRNHHRSNDALPGGTTQQVIAEDAGGRHLNVRIYFITIIWIKLK